MKKLLGSVKDLEQGKEGQKIVDRAEWPDVDHEVADHADVPSLRFVNECLINVVSRNRHLREIVKEVIQQNLRR